MFNAVTVAGFEVQLAHKADDILVEVTVLMVGCGSFFHLHDKPFAALLDIAHQFGEHPVSTIQGINEVGAHCLVCLFLPATLLG